MGTASRPPWLVDFERQHGIPSDTYCGLTPGEMSRAIVAWHSGPAQPVGYRPVASDEERFGWLRAAFGTDADLARIRLLEQCFGARVAEAIAIDWMLPDAEFGRAVAEGLARHFPELSADARAVIGGSYAYSHK